MHHSVLVTERSQCQFGPHLHPRELKPVRDPFREVLGSFSELQTPEPNIKCVNLRDPSTMVREAVSTKKLGVKIVL